MDAVDEQLAAVATVLVEDRVLRRIIKRHRRLPGLGLQVPHADCYTLRRDELAELLDDGDVHGELAKLPERVIAIRGDRAALAAGDPAAWSSAWRAIFHARVHQAYDVLFADKRLTAAAIRERVNRIGQIEFDEIRYVLRQEELLLPPEDDAATYTEFVALYLELAHFEPRSIVRTFPSLHGDANVLATIALDIDAGKLLAESRPAGAPAEPIVGTADGKADEPSRALPAMRADPGALSAAATARKKGNLARAAILCLRAGDTEAARGDLDALAARLLRALTPVEEPTVRRGATARAASINDASLENWTAALLPVAQFAASQSVLRFTAGARLLYDLQAACVVGEREDKVIDVVSWALSGGRLPVVRALPATREVRVAKHLHAASKKIAAVKLASAAERERLSRAVHDMVEHAAHNVRATLRPKIEAALDEVDLRPHHLPERVAQKKIVDELLDQAVDVGRLSLGNLRDTLSHNDLKMQDLRASQLVKGDQLLRADRKLARSLDGVYRPGETYLRFLQKLSSVLFGTPVGRFLSLYLLLPVVGSFIALKGLQEVGGLILKLTLHLEPEIATIESYIGGAVFLWLLLHAPPFRRGVATGLTIVGRGLHAAFVDAPRAFMRLSFMQRFRASWLTTWVVRPAIPSAIVWLCVPHRYDWWIAGATFVVLEAVGHSRIGALVEEIVADALVRSGRQFAYRIIPGLVRYILEFFKWLIELLDRGIYRVDEFLRFKSGQSQVTLVLKGAFGTVWFFVAYFLRLYVNLFVEPTINPVKHFPVVTVAAKITAPFYGELTRAIRIPLARVVGHTLAGSLSWFVVFSIPGFAGFIVWELKANWQLYRATRPDTLRVVQIGHHGETMVALMKPGFHSGTIPKLYAKLRRATWKNDERRCAKHKEGLHHVEEAIWKFADRELISMLNEASAFTPTDVAVGEVELGSNRVQIEIAAPSVAPEPAKIAFEQQSGWLIASIPEAGWLAKLAPAQRRIFELALAGFYKLSGVDIVREQVEDVLKGTSPAAPPYDISDEGMVVWPGRGYQTEVIYDLRSHDLGRAVRGETFEGELPALAGKKTLYGLEPIPWTTWTTSWDQLAGGKEPTRLVVGPSLLPA